MYRCDETEKIWIKCGLLKFPTQLPDLVYSNKRLITLGGIYPEGTPTNSVYSYSLEAQIWTYLPAMITRRVHHCVANVDGIIYAIGGYFSQLFHPTKTGEK